MKKLEVTIADTEAFAEKVADVAYEKAVEAMIAKVVEETHNEDFKVLEDFKRTPTAPKNKKLPDVKRIGGKVLDGLMGRFQRLTKKISEKLTALLRKPEAKENPKNR